jgi:spore maturation protein CgeB
MPDGRFLRAEVIDALMTAGIKIDLFGNYWDGYENWHGYITNFHQMIEVFDRSKICLNLSNPWHHGTMPQIKGRHFEIPQITGMQICTPADDLESYFEFDKEIIVVSSVQELIEKTQYYIENEDERQAIAEAGRARMEKEHQWHHRFKAIFEEVGVL